MGNDIVLVTDYHDKNTEIRRFNEKTGEESCLSVPTELERLSGVLNESRRAAQAQGGKAVWIMESTSGWARVKQLVSPLAELRLVNVLQLPLPPKAKRRKTDKLDTARILREYRTGALPLSFQPRPSLRRLRRLVGLHGDLVRRRTALRNYVNRYQAHETWSDRKGLWSAKGMKKLQAWAGRLAGHDRVVMENKLEELALLEERIRKVSHRLERIAGRWGPARRLDAIRGLGAVAAAGIAACIGPVERFANAEQIIAYAGLAPGIRQSSDTARDGRIGGGGTDKLLRRLLIQASMWARQIPRYQKTYERCRKRRGVKIARLVVARLLLRSINIVLRRNVEFDPQEKQTQALAGAIAAGHP